jgi:hypothetical protein
VAAAAGEFRKRFSAVYGNKLLLAGVSQEQVPIMVAAAVKSITVTAGPLLRSLYHGRITHMPQSQAEFHADTGAVWKDVARSMYGADHGLRLVDHSGRHGGCAHARRKAVDAGWPEQLLRELINAHFCWKSERDRMQVYYTGLLERAKRLRVTAIM